MNNYLIAFVVLSVGFCAASSERLIDLDSIEVSSKKYQFSLSLRANEQENVRDLVLNVSGRRISVPKSEWQGIQDVRVGSLIVSTSSSLADLPKEIEQFIVTIEYGKPVYHKKNGEDLIVSCVVRFVFSRSNYLRRERVVPVEGPTNSWKTYEKATNEVERFIGEAKKAECPVLSQ